MKEIVTERLVLRLLAREDVPAFASYRSDPDVARYQTWDTSYSVEDGERLVAGQDGVDFGAPGPWVQVAAIDRVTGELRGDCAVRVDQPQTAEVGVTFAPASQGTGLATEALRAVVTRLFDAHDIHRVYAEDGRPQRRRAPTARTAGLPVRGAAGRGRLVQRRVDDPAHLRRPAPRVALFNTRKPRVCGAPVPSATALSPSSSADSGGGIRTRDLRVMSPTSYLTAPPRDATTHLIN